MHISKFADVFGCGGKIPATDKEEATPLCFVGSESVRSVRNQSI